MGKTKRISDTSYKFKPNVNYTITAVQKNCRATDGAGRWSTSPVKPVTVMGSVLIGYGIKTAQEYLMSSHCQHPAGTLVHFLEVDYSGNDADYKEVFSGTKLANIDPVPANLADPAPAAISPAAQPIQTTVFAPSQTNDTLAKQYAKSQGEQILALQKQLGELQAESTKKIEALQNEKVELNIEINNLKSDLAVMSARYEEVKSYSDRETDYTEETEPPATLADKAVGILYGTFGQEVGNQIVTNLATGLGNGISKLIELGIDKFSNKSAPVPAALPIQPAQNTQEAQNTQQVQQPQEAQLQQEKVTNNDEWLNQFSSN